MDTTNKVVVIAGPTASGKTSLAVKLAKDINGEIIAADSRTIYKYLDIGTAKPSLSERENVVHHGFDLVEPGNQQFTVADYKNYADKVIVDIASRGKVPILVGGSGLYIDSVVYDFKFIKTDENLRKKLNEMGNDDLVNIIKNDGLDLPINYKNKLHLVNTILRKGRQPTRRSKPKNTLYIGLNPPKQVITESITNRANKMIEDGLIDEINKANKLYGWDSNAMTGGVYRSFKPSFIDGQPYTDSLSNFIKSDLNLVKNQLTWFKANEDIVWFDDKDKAYLWLIKHFKGNI